MKRLLNTLFVTTDGAYLSRDGETVLIRVGEETKLRLPIHTLEGIACFGNTLASPHLMALCAERNVHLSFLTSYGRFMARVQGPISGNVLLRRAQYRWADDLDRAGRIAQVLVAAKVANARAVLLRAARAELNGEPQRNVLDAASYLANLLQRLNATARLDSVRGMEGDAARTYFAVFDHLILHQKEAFRFEGRNRRPPTDNVNALLSFLYTLLTHDVVGACEATGLDPAVGFLHRDRPGRPGLALDLMEQFRAYIVDRLVLTLINRKQVNEKGFRTTESGAVEMTDDTRKTVLVAYQERKQEEITHPFLEEKMSVGLLPHIQALLFARYLRGDLDDYPAFFWK